MEGTQLQIEFGSNTQLRNFIKWMGDYGFEKFMTSSKNNNNPVTCIAADESMDWGHYFEIE
jgi:hypothetical protein